MSDIEYLNTLMRATEDIERSNKKYSDDMSKTCDFIANAGHCVMPGGVTDEQRQLLTRILQSRGYRVRWDGNSEIWASKKGLALLLDVLRVPRGDGDAV